MGILLGVRDPYAAALESTLARFGIPARFHFTSALSAHPAIQYITGIVRSLLTGWNLADLLPLLRMPVNGLGATPEGDRLDFALRERLPAIGLPAGGPLSALDPWKTDSLTPTAWAARLKTLRTLIPHPIDQEQLQIRRSTTAALAAFDTALDNAAQALDDLELPLADFWPHAEATIKSEKFRVPDHRSNVVEVLEVEEARECQFKIAFVPGLTWRDQSLFELATTRATEETILSYPRFNERGDAIIRSSLLAEEGTPASTTRILPKRVEQSHALPEQIPPSLGAMHAKLSPTSIESFLQCPFQFFAARTLQLRARPKKPRDRLDILLQGSILHQAIAEGSFDPVFEAACKKNNIPRGYRTEAVRLELRRHFEAFQTDRQWPLDWPSQTEQQFQIALTPELSIAGRIDRLDTGPNKQAVVIDYKYSPSTRIRDRLRDPGVQGGLYLLATERFFGLEPAGMFFCSLRQPITWEGWHAIPGLELGEWQTPAALRELIIEAEQRAVETFQSIVSGNKEVHPADPNKCR
ncbi:MAG: PD-(D/E)XK nuclease family protein, partial [Bryobacteraceae bacterium]